MSLDGIPITAIVEGLDGDAYVVTIDERKYREHLLSMPLSAEPPGFTSESNRDQWITKWSRSPEPTNPTKDDQ